MTSEYAADIATWSYPEPYARYSSVDGDPTYLVDPANQFFALVDGDHLIGFRSFGLDGRVPGGPYTDLSRYGELLSEPASPLEESDVLDTGGGLRPELTGQGLGRQAIATGLEFGQRRYRPRLWRVTIAAFNARALKVVESLGFIRVALFRASTDNEPYWILCCPSRIGHRVIGQH